MYSDEEYDFVKIVLYHAKDIFNEESDSIRKTRIHKIVFFTAKEVNFDLTRGWYKHGPYSPVTNEVLLKYDISSLANTVIDTFRDIHNDIILKIVPNIRSYICRHMSDYSAKEKNREQFLDWIYYYNTPNQLINVYEQHRYFYKYLEEYSDISEELIEYYLTDTKPMEKCVLEYHEYIYTLEEDVIDLFIEFSDFLSNVILKERLLKYELPDERNEFWSKIKILYMKDFDKIQSDIWSLISPYFNTIEGISKDYEKEHVFVKNKYIIDTLSSKLSSLKEEAKQIGIYPSYEEVEKEYLECLSQ